MLAGHTTLPGAIADFCRIKEKTVEMDGSTAQVSAAVNITAQFNELLQQHSAPPVVNKVSLDDIDSFLKEAYRIVSSWTTTYACFLSSSYAYHTAELTYC